MAVVLGMGATGRWTRDILWSTASAGRVRFLLMGVAIGGTCWAVPVGSLVGEWLREMLSRLVSEERLSYEAAAERKPRGDVGGGGGGMLYTGRCAASEVARE